MSNYDEITVSNGEWLVNVFNPSTRDFNYKIVARSLAGKYRFGGFRAPGRKRITVAQHCVLVSKIVKAENALYGLGHEADEVYLPDIVSPIKNELNCTVLDTLSVIHLNVLLQAWNLQPTVDAVFDVKRADLISRFAEARDQMNVDVTTDHHWNSLEGVEPFKEIIDVWDIEQAEKEFIKRFEELKNI